MLTFGFKKELSVFALTFLFLDAFCQPNLVVEVGEEQYSTNQKLTLKAGSYEICFRFPENQNQEYVYEYHLENLDQKTKTTIYPLIRYTNVTGGSYVFRVKIKENNQAIAEFIREIEIKENFWEKWWFWLFVVFFGVLAVGLLIYFWFLYDFRQRMKTEQIRQRIAADLHDEVGANLSSISFLVSSLKRKISPNDLNSTGLLEKIAHNSTESATLINDTIWALNPTYDSFDKLLERIKSFASGVFSTNDIAFLMENNLEKPDFELSIEQRRNLYLILKEAVNNAAKHAKAQKVFLRINPTDNGIQINVEDDGVGFDTQAFFEGNGLKNYHVRALENDIKVELKSKAGKGTTVTIELMTKNH